MKKKITLIILAAVLLLGCGVAAWMYVSSVGKADDGTNFVPINMNNHGALSDQGYYYVRSGGILHYTDLATQKSIVLCSRAVCAHNSKNCDAYIGSMTKDLFFCDDQLYYIEQDEYGLHLNRRDATGSAFLKIGSLGTKYIEQQMSVSVNNYFLAEDYLYYTMDIRASVPEESGGMAVQDVIACIGRMHLATGRDEVLIEEPLDKNAENLALVCARKEGFYFVQWEGIETERIDSNYSELLYNSASSLKFWDAESKEVSTVFQKDLRQFSDVKMVWDGMLYYRVSSAVAGENAGCSYAYDLSLGKEVLICEDNLWHLGGGYALRTIGETDSVIFDLKTGKDLPNVLNDLSSSVPILRAMSADGCVIEWTGEVKKEKPADTTGSATVYNSYITYASLADGLQETDLLTLYSYETSVIEEPTTNQTEPEVTYPPFSLEPHKPVPDEEMEITVQYLPETVENPNNLPVLKWVCMGNWGDKVWSEKAVHELNEMLSDRNMSFRIQFVMITTTLIDERLSGWFSRPVVLEELEDADLIFSEMKPDEQVEYLHPITEYVTGDAQPSLKNAVHHELNWNGTIIDGQIYGIRTYPIPAGSHGWMVDPSVMEKCGLTAEDFSSRNFWEMDEVFSKIYEMNGKQPFMELSANITLSGLGDEVLTIMPSHLQGQINNDYQFAGACFGIDLTAQTPTVVNMIESDTTQKIMEAYWRYKAAGYVSNKSGTKSLVAFSYMDSNAPYRNQFDYFCIPVTQMTYKYYYASHDTCGIAAVSQHKEEAVTLLNLIAEDEAFREHLCFGKEGRDYTLTDGKYSITTQEEGTTYNMEFLTMYSKFSPVTEGRYAFYPALNGKNSLETYRDHLDSVVTFEYPIIFDFTGFEDELSQIGEIMNTYSWTFATMSEEDYEYYLQAIVDAGADEIQAELQRQLDEWLVNNPDWDK